MPAMERLIWVTWRAFWIGLGASLVLILQALAPTPTPAAFVAPGPNVAANADPPACAPAVPSAASKSADPILSRNPFDSKTGPLVPPAPKRPRGA